jgi:MFS transporter, DHA1 family, multidrug resistance protein
LSFTSKSTHIPGWLLLIAAMTGVGPIAIDMYLPGFAAIESDLGEQGVEHTMAAFLIGQSIGQLFFGPISDRFGRKPPLYVGLALFTLGSLGCMLASSMFLLIAMRTVQALGGCASVVIGRAIVRDRCEPDEAARAFSTLMLIVALGPIIAPMLGGWIVTALGWRAIFGFQCLMGAVLLLAMHFVLTESRDPRHVVPFELGAVARGYGHLLADRVFIGYSLVTGFGMGAMFCYVTGAPTVLTDLYELSPQHFGWLLGLNGLAFMTASRLNIFALRKKGPQELLARSIYVPSILGCLMVLLSSLWHLPLWVVVLWQFSFFIATVRVNPNIAALALAPHGREAGAASALMGSLQSGTAMLASVAVAIFADGTVRTLAAMMTAGVIFGLLFYVWARRPTARPS